ncbi:hypothetical protein L2E82_10266 [Cichorium intybus]|uniref:Uncharacterized protein n=1 Tax=Cichorium intybus TaxID=13427 RepID=A0ACB9GB63_CICIN|nr:hypothetical protein L2E82_10266 [Cichorium intybus]
MPWPPLTTVTSAAPSSPPNHILFSEQPPPSRFSGTTMNTSLNEICHLHVSSMKLVVLHDELVVRSKQQTIWFLLTALINLHLSSRMNTPFSSHKSTDITDVTYLLKLLKVDRHFGEGMRVVFEPWFVKYKVDLVFSGYVHSYECSERVSNIRYNITDGLSTLVKDPSAPVYITIGDGGNIEGIADREASFGHVLLEINNRTHALYNWHRNQDNVVVSGDSMCLKSFQLQEIGYSLPAPPPAPLPIRLYQRSSL